MNRLLLTAALASAACAHAGPKTRIVTSEGYAPMDGRGLADARDRAVNDARRRAIESVSGVSVESTSRVEGAVTTEQNVTSRSRGFVEQTTPVVEEVRDGMIRVRLRARVREGPAPWSTVALRIPEGPLAAGVARALREKRIGADGGRGAPELTGAVRTTEVKGSLIAGTTAMRANAALTLGGGPEAIRVLGAASGLDLDAESASDKAVEAAGYRAGLALAAAMKAPD